MGSQLGALSRLVSPFTLLIGALLFLLPFCAVACNGPLGGGSTNLITATGLNLATGADVTPDCTALNQTASAIGSSIANSFGGSASANAPNQGSSCSNSTSSSTGTSSGSLGGISGGNPVSGAATTANLGPFVQSSQPGQVHVDRQPLAIAALGLLVLGAVVAVLRHRVSTLLAALVALAAAGCLIALRITLNSSFSNDLKGALAGSSGTTATLGLDPTSLFSLSWGLGWTLALVAGVLAATVNLASLLLPRLAQNRAPASDFQPGSGLTTPPGYAGYPYDPGRSTPAGNWGNQASPGHAPYPNYPSPGGDGTHGGSSRDYWMPPRGTEAGQDTADAGAPQDR